MTVSKDTGSTFRHIFDPLPTWFLRMFMTGINALLGRIGRTKIDMFKFFYGFALLLSHKRSRPDGRTGVTGRRLDKEFVNLGQLHKALVEFNI